MNEDFPYNEDEVAAFARVLSVHTSTAECDLRLLQGAGITLTFPKPRFTASEWGRAWRVIDTLREDDDDPFVVAWFYGNSNEMFAKDHAERLNKRHRARSLLMFWAGSLATDALEQCCDDHRRGLY